MSRIVQDKDRDSQEGKYAWFQIDNLVFTAPKYLTEYMDAILGADDNREVIWINKSSPHMYATRWRPDFCYIYIPVNSADNFNAHLRFNKIGNLVVNTTGQFQQFTKAQIDKVSNSVYYPDLIGKHVRIIHGPLEDFYATVTGYSSKLHKYILTVKLLISEIQIPHHLHEFEVIDDSHDVDNVADTVKNIKSIIG